MGTLIQIIGPSGAGKSYVVREVIRRADHVKNLDGAIQLTFNKVLRPVVVIGSYNAPTGGCDAVRDQESVWNMLEELAQRPVTILYEGLLIMNQTRAPKLLEKLQTKLVVPMHIFWLDIPLNKCIEGINERRAERGDGPLEDQQHTKSNFTRSRNYQATMREAGATIHRVTRETAVKAVLAVL